MGWSGALVGHASGLGDSLSLLVNLVVLVPSLAASSRRFHDTGRSGCRILLMLTVFGIAPVAVWWASEGNKEQNKFG